MDEPLAFAYGSNLCEVDRRRWCAEHPDLAGGLDDFVARVIGPAYLPDHEPAYRYRSAVRGGGALDARLRPGGIVPGALLAVRGEVGWRALDAKEGLDARPPRYQRTEATVLALDGSAVRARTYTVTAERREPGFVPPAPGYAEAIASALCGLGLDPGRHAQAARGEPVTPLDEVFIYGTLLPGEAREGALGEVRRRRPARARGRLVQPPGADFPTLVDAGSVGAGCASLSGRRGEAGWVEGEVVALADLGGSLARLDEVEGFLGFASPLDSERFFDRRLLEVEVLDALGPGGASAAGAEVGASGSGGGLALAWVYVMPEAPLGSRPLPSGSWRRR